MLRALQRCALGLLWMLGLWAVDGLIEIVEEQRCQDYEFRLTCRELDTHIAVLEAWYTSLEDLDRLNSTQPQQLRIKTENDSELNRVYVYSSPRHNGIYVPTNRSFENDTSDGYDGVVYLNDSLLFLNDSADVGIEFVNVSEGCGTTFARSYASWHEGDKRRRPVDRRYSINLRSPVSYRCTGVNHCSFILSQDYPAASRWAPGVVYVKYACFDGSFSLHYCNRKVSIAPSGPQSEGYIRTPGYPNFYVGDECRWRLVASPEQRVQVTLLDVSLRSIGPFESRCADRITVQETDGVQILSSCDQVEMPLSLTSTTNSVDVSVKVKSRGAYPKRGVLLHYKSVGCVTLPAPPNGYLVYRNEEVAHYNCNEQLVFVDTRQRARIIWCYDDNRWNDTVPFCVAADADVEPPSVRGNESTSPGQDTNMPHNEDTMIVDIVIPSLLIAALFIGNAFIVLIIYKYRKRKNDDLEDEFNTIPLSVNGNIQNVGNAV